MADDGGTELVSPGGGAPRCPMCGTPRNGTDRYCEIDGYAFEATGVWIAEVIADRDYYEGNGEVSVAFPEHHRPYRFPLRADEVSLGRSSDSAGVHPDIDLAADPGVSRFHALFVRDEQGSYGIEDAGSTNGTTINDDPTPLSPNQRIPLSDGDRVHLGAWTTVVVRCEPDDDD